MSDHTPSIPKVGDHLVYSHSFGYDVRGPVIRITEASAFVPKGYGSGERRISFDVIVFSGDEASARRLDNYLTSSRALRSEEERKVAERHEKRNDRLIKAACAKNAAPASRVSSANRGGIK